MRLLMEIGDIIDTIYYYFIHNTVMVRIYSYFIPMKTTEKRYPEAKMSLQNLI